VDETFRATGNNGIQPDILERIKWCQDDGRKWFREVVNVSGRRGGKGYVGALCMAYVLWCYMAYGDPQGHYGVDRSKKLAAMCFAGKLQQAKEQVWRDLVNVIIEAPCFQPFIADLQAEKLTVYAPKDFVKMRKMKNKGVDISKMNMATFEIVPLPSTLMSGRGPASFMQCYDEMAHVVASGANRSAEEVYGAATPSLDQFGKDGFIYEPSSPWQMMGQFYENYNMALQRDPVAFDDDGAVIKDEAAYPTIMMVQLTSWDPYVDWERSHLIPMYPPGFLDGVDDEDIPRFTRKKNAIQEYDLQMQKLEKSNPETFAVERRSHFATALDAYLNPNMVDRMFTGEWKGRPIVMQPEGKLHLTYKAHGDPALVNDRFGFAVAHAEVDEETGLLHCVFDVVHYWEAQDWPDNVIDYIHVEKDLWGFVQAFKPDELTFDQWNSASSIQKLQMQVRQANFNKRVQVFCKPANSTYNFSRAETFKTALNMGWLHAPMSGTDRAVDVAINELKFLQFINGKVDHPDMGPVQSKDVADCLMECVQTLIGDQVNNFLAHSLGTQAPKGMMQGGDDPLKRFSSPNEGNPTLSGFLAGRTGDRTQRAQQGSSMGNYLKTGIRRGSRGSGNPFKGRTPWDNDA
jgi:hypothetical protein